MTTGREVAQLTIIARRVSAAAIPYLETAVVTHASGLNRGKFERAEPEQGTLSNCRALLFEQIVQGVERVVLLPLSRRATVCRKFEKVTKVRAIFIEHAVGL